MNEEYARWTTDPQLRITSVGGSFLDAARIADSDLLGRELAELIDSHTVAHPVIAAHLQAIYGEVATFSYDWLGRSFAIRVAPHDGGGVTGMAHEIGGASEFSSGFDPVTGVASRALFREHVDRAIFEARRQRATLGVLVVALNGRPNNAIRRIAAFRIAHAVREAFVARIGEAEFAVATTCADASWFDAVAAVLLGAFEEPFVVGHEQLDVKARVTLAVDVRDGRNADELLRRAHALLTLGQEPAPYSPLVRLSDGALVGLVARGDNECALADIETWGNRGTARGRVVITPTLAELTDSGFLHRAATAECDVELQISEEMASAYPELASHLTITDFGVGRSSLDLLNTVRPTCLDIAADLVAELPASPAVDAIATIARLYGVKLVASGVERPDQARHLARVGCQEASGSLFGAAMTAEEAIPLLRNHDRPSVKIG